MFSSLTQRYVNRFGKSQSQRRRRQNVDARRLSVEPLEDRALLAVDVTNLGLDATDGVHPQIDGDLTAFTVREWSQGNTDLNGDGDMFDAVLHIYDAASDTTTNLGLASTRFRLDGNVLAFTVREDHQGNIDLNGDGDSSHSDHVVHVYDAATGTVSNLGLSAPGDLELDGSLLAFAVSEFGQGNTDLNGDGDTNDKSVHVYDATSGTTTNLGLTLSTFGVPLHVKGDTVGISVPEYGQGNTDLNGDGDTTDRGVMHVYNAATGVTTNLELAGGGVTVSEDLVVFVVRESSQANTDLNGDGDTLDSIVHIHDIASGVTTNLEETPGSELTVEGNLVAFWGPFEGDGSVRVYDATSGNLTNLGLRANTALSPIVGGRFAFGVYEEAAGNIDLNGDGDTTDGQVIHVYDAATGILTNVGIDGHVSEVVGDVVTFVAAESSTADLNGDGDLFDRVVHLYNVVSGVTTNLGLDSGFIRSDGTLLAFAVRESHQGNTDLNGDGDTADTVVHVYDVAAGVTTNLELADDAFRMRVSASRVEFVVSEANQGNTDLNGDGDTSDFVMHIADFSVQTVEIDIQPHSDDNMLNVGISGMISVAILTTEDFDATQVDIASVQFAGAFANHGMLHDVDHDGDLDMVLYFRVQDTVLDEIYAQLVQDDLNGDGILDSNHQAAEVSLTGETLDDSLFGGSDEMDLFLTGRKLRELLDDLAAAQVI